MKLEEIKQELNKLAKEISEQSKYLEISIKKGNLKKGLIAYGIPEFSDKYSKGKNANLPIEFQDKVSRLAHQEGISIMEATQKVFDKVILLAREYQQLQKEKVVYYDSFEEMLQEIEEIKSNVENAGKPENLEGWYEDIISDYDSVINDLNEIINGGFESIQDIITFLNEIVDKISNII